MVVGFPDFLEGRRHARRIAEPIIAFAVVAMAFAIAVTWTVVGLARERDLAMARPTSAVVASARPGDGGFGCSVRVKVVGVTGTVPVDSICAPVGTQVELMLSPQHRVLVGPAPNHGEQVAAAAFDGVLAFGLALAAGVPLGVGAGLCIRRRRFGSY